MRLNLLCSLLEMTILPPPGGPIAARRNISYEIIKFMITLTSVGGIYLDMLDCLFLSVIPEAIVYPLLYQFQWWL